MISLGRRHMRDKLSRFAPLLRGRVVDIGAGNKPYREFFQHVDHYLGANTRGYYGQSVSDEIARNTDVWIDGTLPLPFTAQEFDNVVCFQVLSIIDKPEEFMRELSRILKPGGRLILSTDFLYPKWDEHDSFRYTDASLRALAGKTRFSVIAIEGFGGYLTTVHAMTMRWIRDHRPHRTSGLRRIMLYAMCLLVLPLWTVFGWIAMLTEGKRRNDFTYCSNLFVVAERLPETSGER